MVGAPTQALVAQQLGMDNYIISRQQLTQEKMGWKQKILADLMEAFIAALFICKSNISHICYANASNQSYHLVGASQVLPTGEEHDTQLLLPVGPGGA